MNKKSGFGRSTVFPEAAFFCKNFKKESSFFKKGLDKRNGLLYNIRAIENAALAQLDRVFGYEPKGRGFESLTPRHGVGPKKMHAEKPRFSSVFLFFTPISSLF